MSIIIINPKAQKSLSGAADETEVSGAWDPGSPGVNADWFGAIYDDKFTPASGAGFFIGYKPDGAGGQESYAEFNVGKFGSWVADSHKFLGENTIDAVDRFTGMVSDDSVEQSIGGTPRKIAYFAGATNDAGANASVLISHDGYSYFSGSIFAGVSIETAGMITASEVRAEDDAGLWLREDGGAKGLKVLDSGNVYVTDRLGVGTLSPNAPVEIVGARPAGTVGGFYSGMLQIRGDGTAEFSNVVITGHNSFNTNTQLWYLGSTSSNNNDIAFINRQNADLILSTNDIERMRIGSSGNVGTGTATPGVINGVDITSQHVLHNYSASLVSRVVAEGSSAGVLDLIDRSGAEDQKWVAMAVSDEHLYIGALDDSADIAFDLITADLSNGNIGIGITSLIAGARLTVANGSGSAIMRMHANGAGDNASFNMYTGGVNRAQIGGTQDSGNGGKMELYTRTTANAWALAMTIDDDQNVGLGIATPNTNARLHLVDGAGTLPGMGAGDVLIVQNNDDTSDWCSISMIAGAAQASVLNFGDAADKNIGRVQYDHTDNYMAFYANASERMRISSSGNVKHPSFSSGWKPLGGHNWQIAADGTVEVENLSVRGWLHVNELIINTIHSVNGMQVISIANGTVGEVTDATLGDETVNMEDPSNRTACSFAEGDLILVQRFAIDNTTVVKSEYRRVKGVNGIEVDFEYDGRNSATDAIAKGDVIVAYGNDITSSRTASIAISTLKDSTHFGYAPYIRIFDDVEDPDEWMTAAKCRIAIGNLNGMYGYSSDVYGFAAGLNTEANVTIDPTNGVRFRYSTTDLVVIDSDGATFKSNSGTGQRIEIDASASTLSWFDSDNNEVILIDDNVFSIYPGIKMINSVLVMESPGAAPGGHVVLGGPNSLPGIIFASTSGDFRADIRRTNSSLDILVRGDSNIPTAAQGIVISNGGNVAIKQDLTIDGTTSPIGQVLLSNGLVSAPSLSFASDPDTGIYRLTANTLAITVGGTIAAQFNSTWGIYPRVLQTTLTAANLQCTGATSPIKRSNSSARYKDVIRPLEIDTSLIYQLSPRSYKSKVDLDDKGKPRDGFFGLIAEEVAQVIPQLCTYDEDGKPDWVQYPFLSVLMLPELKKHEEAINLMSPEVAKIASLEAEIVAIKQQIGMA